MADIQPRAGTVLTAHPPERGGDPRMDTQISPKTGFPNNAWVQMAALLVLAIVVIALAAKYIW